MKIINFNSKLKRQIENIYKMFKYGYVEDYNIKGKNISYGHHKKQYYRVYKGDNNKYTIFFVHGGGWWQGSPSLYSGIGKYLSKNGYNTVLVGYRLVPKSIYPNQIDDVFKAFRHYLDNNIKASNFIIGGYSAGSEIATHLAYDIFMHKKYNINHKVISGFISIAGVLDFSKCYSKASKKLIKNYIKDENINNANPINILNKNITIQNLCIHGDKDSLISVDNSISFINRLKMLDKNANLKIIKNIDHEHAIDLIRGPGNIHSKYIFDFIKGIDKLKINE